MTKRDFLAAEDWQPEEIDAVLALAQRIKRARCPAAWNGRSWRWSSWIRVSALGPASRPPCSSTEGMASCSNRAGAAGAWRPDRAR